MTVDYPEEPAGDFPAPPRTLADRTGREITYEAADEADRGALMEMYLNFDPADRAQGIPPVQEPAIADWLDSILSEDCFNVVARHEGAAVGHTTLVPDRHGHNELAIFVHQDYQGAGIGTELVQTLLGLGQDNGVEEVWLTVERWNDPAIALYRKVGFQTNNSERFELEMTIRI
ncbi:GNAT family N-acetyltransferase [Halomicroarcula sp. GCM10025324]|uniref:GNAT family N-acetyltransferase n=1 Tax=Haloarcula TaxID=2237 RepID=UPI0023E8734F|nr:GNAT family N-acetyltransferase [Halomicroarcula sp. ZS-22-S1]